MDINFRNIRMIGNIKLQQKKEEICEEKEENSNTTKEIAAGNNKTKVTSSTSVLNFLEKTEVSTSEKFSDVRAEMDKNVPDRTTTTEEKEKALSYIERMLKCDDITPELKNYWENKKDTIKMEIQSIKNEEQAGKDNNYNKVHEEYRDFIQQHWCENYPEERNKSLEFLDSEEYGLAFYDTCLAYLDRMLACEDLPEEEKSNLEQEINHWNGEKQSRLGEINWYKQNQNIKTESFDDVFEEFSQNVPDRTTTLEEKKLAAGYIKRIVCCDDIPADLKNYWSNKEDIINMEMQNIINNKQIGNDENIDDVACEWREFTDRYWNKTSEFDNVADRVEYYRSYYNMYISFCDRALECNDLSEEDRTQWTSMKMGAITDLNYHNRDFNIYNNENNIKTESYESLVDNYQDFINSYWGDNYPEFNYDSAEQMFHYCISFYDGVISFCERILSCDDLPDEARKNFEGNRLHWNIQKQHELAERNHWQQENNIPTESFNDVYADFDRDVPDSTTTTEEKNLAICYIRRMLACDDIPNDLKEYWQDKLQAIKLEKAELESEKILNHQNKANDTNLLPEERYYNQDMAMFTYSIKNNDLRGSGEKVSDVWNEFSNFINNYFDSINDNMTMEQKMSNRSNYYNTYKSFIARLMNCNDITEKQRTEYSRMEYYADRDLTNWENDYKRYKDSL